MNDRYKVLVDEADLRALIRMAKDFQDITWDVLKRGPIEMGMTAKEYAIEKDSFDDDWMSITRADLAIQVLRINGMLEEYTDIVMETESPSTILNCTPEMRTKDFIAHAKYIVEQGEG